MSDNLYTRTACDLIGAPCACLYTYADMHVLYVRFKVALKFMGHFDFKYKSSYVS